jgi:hypothetical protein
MVVRVPLAGVGSLGKNGVKVFLFSEVSSRGYPLPPGYLGRKILEFSSLQDGGARKIVITKGLRPKSPISIS